MKTKMFLALGGLLVLSLSIAACGDDDESSDEANKGGDSDGDGSGGDEGGGGGSFVAPSLTGHQVSNLSGEDSGKYPKLVTKSGGYLVGWMKRTSATDDTVAMVTGLDAAGAEEWTVALSEEGDGAWYVDIADSGDGFGVVWEGEKGIEFATVTAAGAAGTALSVTEQSSIEFAHPYRPSLAWSETAQQYGVAFFSQEMAGALVPDVNHGYVFFCRIDAAGTLQGDPVLVDASNYDPGRPSIVWNGTDFAVAWSGINGIAFATLSAAGAPVASPRILGGNAFSTGAQLVWTGSGYGLAWREEGSNDSYGIAFYLLDATGTPQTRQANLGGAGSAMYFSLAWTGAKFGVVWGDDAQDHTTGAYQAYMGEISQTGQSLGSAALFDTWNSAGEVSPSIIWDGSRYAIAYHDYPESPFTGGDTNTEIFLAIP